MTSKVGFSSALTAHLEREKPPGEVAALAAAVRAFLSEHVSELDGVSAVDAAAAPPKISGLRFVTPVAFETSRYLNDIEAVWLMSTIINLLNENLARFAGVARFRDDAAPPIKR